MSNGMPKTGFITVMGLVYIAVWCGIGIASVGQMPTTPPEPYPWWLPFELLIILGFAFLLGYWGRASEGGD